jgi:hypothetical protein
MADPAVACGRARAGPFTTRWYNDPILDVEGKPTGATTPVGPIAPESVIVSPAPDQAPAVGEDVDVWGWAWADGGVSAVEVSADDAGGWMPAALERPAGRAWQRFAATWRPRHRGAHELWSRARSADGRRQGRGGAQCDSSCADQGPVKRTRRGEYRDRCRHPRRSDSSFREKPPISSCQFIERGGILPQHLVTIGDLFCRVFLEHAPVPSLVPRRKPERLRAWQRIG